MWKNVFVVVVALGELIKQYVYYVFKNSFSNIQTKKIYLFEQHVFTENNIHAYDFPFIT